MFISSHRQIENNRIIDNYEKEIFDRRVLFWQMTHFNNEPLILRIRALHHSSL